MEDPLRSPSTRRKVHSVWYVTDKHRYHKVFLCKGAAQTWLERQKSLEPDGRAGVREYLTREAYEAAKSAYERSR